MSKLKTVCAVVMVALLSACVGGTESSRNVTPTYLSTDLPDQGTVDVVAAPTALAIKGIEIIVPRSLKVSEADVFIPMADIVWRGQPMGDRHQQVEAIFQTAANRASVDLTEGRGVIVSIEVTRFHGLTEKTRYTTGGNYAMHFNLTLRDAQTGIVLDGPRAVVADIRGSGGVRAIAEDNAGRTEIVVVTERLEQVLRGELTTWVPKPTL